MYFDFRTSYTQDIRLFRRTENKAMAAVALVALLAAPLVLPTFYLTESASVMIFAIIVVGFMMAAGMAGLISLGHAAFVGIGGYTQAVALSHGVPMLGALALATAITGLAGLILGVLSLRLSGLYLGIATLIFGLAIEHVFVVWDAVTGGPAGLLVPDPQLFGVVLTGPVAFYYLCLAALLAVILVCVNLMRSASGRALIAIRDSEPAAQSLGVNLLRLKLLAVTMSAAITGLGGAFFAHRIVYLTPEGFNLMLSLQIVLAAVIGGLGSISGAVMGAVLIGWLPEITSIIKSWLPPSLAYQPGPDLVIYGGLLVVFVIFEPLGLYGRWRKVSAWLRTFPLDRRETFARTRSYMKSERVK
ncbi:branched-chain amino acid ABC transporter permease [Pseudooceanicola aestuarii]|uniref:branched-chain amino acid ABC transporter permease n=1 Tax=Pseudooceanicola aestuarii TaxID=2697319 RepID=UPI0013D60772|nr:branched-chain amino acid ABC transporter permease [Pseudooceanicola aestuarii]